MVAPMPSERVPLSQPLTEPGPPAGEKARELAPALVAIIAVRDSATVLPSCLAALRRGLRRIRRSGALELVTHLGLPRGQSILAPASTRGLGTRHLRIRQARLKA